MRPSRRSPQVAGGHRHFPNREVLPKALTLEAIRRTEASLAPIIERPPSGCGPLPSPRWRASVAPRPPPTRTPPTKEQFQEALQARQRRPPGGYAPAAASDGPVSARNEAPSPLLNTLFVGAKPHQGGSIMISDRPATSFGRGCCGSMRVLRGQLRESLGNPSPAAPSGSCDADAPPPCCRNRSAPGGHRDLAAGAGFWRTRSVLWGQGHGSRSPPHGLA